MSKSTPKIKHTRKPHKPLPEPKPPMSQKTKSLLWIALVVVLAAIPFSLGKYFEFNSPSAFDSGAYVYSAAHILDGAEIGVEEIPSAQLGTLLVNILGVKLFGFNDFGPKLIQMFLQAGVLILMFAAMRKLYGSIPPAAVGVIIASVYLSAPLIAKYGNVKEQYMIVFMIAGASCFVFYEFNKKWYMAVLAGALASWAPLFKQTGLSVIGGIGLFVIAQAILKHKTVKQVGTDILLLLAGVVAAMAPLYIWILAWNVKLGLPYAFVWTVLSSLIPAGGGEAAQAGGGYISDARRLVPLAEQWPIVLRWYALMILPIAMSVAAIGARVLRLVRSKVSAMKPEPKGYGRSILLGLAAAVLFGAAVYIRVVWHVKLGLLLNVSVLVLSGFLVAIYYDKAKGYDRFVLLFAAWWILDMAFVWISPHSYEEYYLPLNASAAMLGGYVIAIYYDKAKSAMDKLPWIGMGAVDVVVIMAMSWHIFFGILRSPHTGQEYGGRARGYSQKYREIAARREQNLKGPWELLGEYIKANSVPDDKMYVWGWWPGIYLIAQRFSSASKAFCMPRKTPAALATEIDKLLTEFKEEMPKFIVDARKRHIPTNRPPYELWPVVIPPTLGVAKPRFLNPTNKAEVDAYDKAWHNYLAKFEEAEALRYDELKPFREFVMNNYRIVQMFGQHVLFELKKPATAGSPN